MRLASNPKRVDIWCNQSQGELAWPLGVKRPLEGHINHNDHDLSAAMFRYKRPCHVTPCNHIVFVSTQSCHVHNNSCNSSCTISWTERNHIKYEIPFDLDIVSVDPIKLNVPQVYLRSCNPHISLTVWICWNPTTLCDFFYLFTTPLIVGVRIWYPETLAQMKDIVLFIRCFCTLEVGRFVFIMQPTFFWRTYLRFGGKLPCYPRFESPAFIFEGIHTCLILKVMEAHCGPHTTHSIIWL